MKPFKFFFALIVALFALTANAANYFESRDSCEAAWHAGKTVDYQPTAKHKNYGEARVAGLGKRPIEGDACALLEAQPGKRWVFMKEGTQSYTRGPEVEMLAECQNRIFEIHYLKKEESQAAANPKKPNKTGYGRCDWTDPKTGKNFVAHGYSQKECVGNLTAQALKLGYEEICKANLQNKEECLDV